MDDRHQEHRSHLQQYGPSTAKMRTMTTDDAKDGNVENATADGDRLECARARVCVCVLFIGIVQRN